MRPEDYIDSPSSRGAIKRLGATLDQQPALKRQVYELACSRGVALPKEALGWPGKRLLRYARARTEQAQTRSNPIQRDEAFTCVGCERPVPPHGRSARDHCPWCLVGLHVDAEVPGDRASTCGGVLRPKQVWEEKGRWILGFVCDACGAERRNQVLLDGDPPDDWKAVVSLTARA